MADTDLLGTRVGHIRLIDFVAEGGMGSVYVGFDETLERRVAVKAIHAARRLDREAQARFKREARVLSSLAHPGICQIHDYLESDGRDFLVLELVPGRNLKDGLGAFSSVSMRAEIAAQIVDVLVAAHSKGIIHRDLKPSNLMVTPEGKVKVLDFGLARTSEEELVTHSWVAAEPGSDGSGAPGLGTEGAGSEAYLTRLGAILGTLEYMSPEQARGEAATPASDIYSLGLVLQELFTQRRPFEEGLAPSVLLEKARAGATRPVAGIDRDWAALINRLKSMAPAARPSAVDVAERIRFIRNRPRRRLRRLGVAGVIGLLVLVVAGLSVQARRIASEAERANREAEVARSVSNFLVELFRVSDPSEVRGNTVTAREILDRGAARVATELKDQPEVQARLLHIMALVYDRLGIYDAAARLAEQAVAQREKALGQDHPDLASSLSLQGFALYHQGRFSEAEPLLRRALAIHERALGPEDPELAQSLFRLGELYRQVGRGKEAEPLLRRLLATQERAHGADSREVVQALNGLGTLYREQQRLAEAQSVAERALTVAEKALPPDDVDLADSLTSVGNIKLWQDKHDEAEPLLLRALSIVERSFGPEHPTVGRNLNMLGALYVAQGQYANAQGQSAKAREQYSKAEPLFLRVLAIWTRKYGPEHRMTASVYNNLGEVARGLGRYAEGEAFFRRSLAIKTKVLQTNHYSIGNDHWGLANVLTDQKRYRAAELEYKRAQAIFEVALAPNAPSRAKFETDYAAFLRKVGRTEDAQAAERAQEIRAKNAPSASP